MSKSVKTVARLPMCALHESDKEDRLNWMPKNVVDRKRRWRLASLVEASAIEEYEPVLAVAVPGNKETSIVYDQSVSEFLSGAKTPAPYTSDRVESYEVPRPRSIRDSNKIPTSTKSTAATATRLTSLIIRPRTCPCGDSCHTGPCTNFLVFQLTETSGARPSAGESDS